MVLPRTIYLWLKVLCTSFILVSCLAPVDDKKKVSCVDGQVFNSKSRKCIQSAVGPQGELGAISLIEDGADKTVKLIFKDANGDIVSNCEVNPSNNNVIITSPARVAALADATSITSEATIIANNIVNAGLRATAQAAALSATNDATSANQTDNNSQIVSYLRQIVTSVKVVADSAQADLSSTSNALGLSLHSRAAVLTQFANWVDQKCSCTGGECSTLVRGAKNFNGLSGFNYSLTDTTGVKSNVKTVSVSVSSVNDLPAAIGTSVTVTESTTSTAAPIAVTLPTGRDIEDDLSPNFHYELVSAPAVGTVTGCMGLGGSAKNDRTCTYTPTSGDSFGNGSTASGVLGDFTFNAKGNGGYGNSIQVVLSPLTGGQVAGSETISVSGQVITVYIESGVTTALTIKNLIVNDIYASSLVDVTLAPVNEPNAQATGNVTLAGGLDGLDKFTYRVFDGSHYSDQVATVNINVTAADDPPVNNVAGMGSIVMNEDAISTLTLLYTDAESQNATACTVGGLTQLRITTACTCDGAGVCTVSLRPAQDYPNPSQVDGTGDGPASFTYSVSYSGGAVSSATSTVNLYVDPANDTPHPLHFSTTVTESASAVATPISFTIPTAIDTEGSFLNYSLVTAPTGAMGTLANCLGLNSSSANDLTCDFTPLDGNLSGVGTTASLTVLSGSGQNITYTATTVGEGANGVSIQYTDDISIGTNPVVSVDGSAINVFITAGTTTLADITNAIGSHPVASALVSAAASSGAALQNTTQAATNLAGGADGAIHFTYKVNDGTADSAYNGKASIHITPEDDTTVMCAYTPFNQANECGIAGCIGTISPTEANITPSATGLIYYNKGNSVCYKSTGTTNATNWAIITAAADFIPNQTINEKDKVIISNIKVDEGGGDTAEDAQQLVIPDSITSSNTTLIPVANIKLFYRANPTAAFSDVTPSGGDSTFGSANSEDIGDFKIEITPVGTLTGSSTVTLQLRDNGAGVGATPITISFDVTVNSSSAQHAGWVNLKAMGPTVNRLDQVTGHNKVCTFSRDKCNTRQSCTGSSTPVGTVTPDQTNAIYYESNTDKCYYSTGTSSADWVEFSSYCNISPSEHNIDSTGASACSGASCIGTATPVGALKPERTNLFYYDRTNNICYRSTDTTANTDWQSYVATGTASLKWDDFTVSGSGTISGFQVYRRIANEEFDYNNPINKTVLASTVNDYIDNETNSWYAPVPNTVYFYDVRPIINSIPTATNESYNVARVTIPGPNRVFAHRWSLNRKICELIHSTPDSSSNYRCSYEGPGDTGAASPNFYDVGGDLIIDQFEAGCHFNESPVCTGMTADGSCVGTSAPTTTAGIADGSVFYDRSSGKCYVKETTWKEFTALTDKTPLPQSTANPYRNSELPPLVHVTQADADGFCANVSSITSTQILGLSGTAAVATRLPSRKQQIAYGQWDTSSIGDGAVTTLESGVDLGSSAKCNSTSASGLTAGYTNSESPDSSNSFSMPGTLISGIRSIATGSAKTNTCVSQFDVQDTVGNVKEWVSERFSCSNDTTPGGLKTCTSLISGAGNTLTAATTDLRPGDGTDGSFSLYQLDGDVGPCNKSGATCDSLFDSWTIATGSFSAQRFALPMGLPIVGSLTSGVTAPYMLELGTSGGVEVSKLHNDTMSVNLDNVTNDRLSVCTSMATGGSYLSGTGGGTYHFEFLPCDAGAKVATNRVDIGLRCVSKIIYDGATQHYAEKVLTSEPDP